MTSKLVPSDPAKVMVIREVVPRTITTFSVPFWRFGRIKIGGRGTVVRMQNGSLAVFSPVALTDDVKRKVSEMGEVKYITALDAEHHIFLGPWHAAYPNAKVLGPEGLPEKRAKQKNEDVPFSYIFSQSKPLTSIDADFDAEFEYEFVYAHQNKELVFNHKSTKTLIQADLIFNYPPTEQFSKTGVSATSGILTKIFGALTNTRGNGQKRLIWWGISSGDRMGYAKSVERIDKWDFERIIPCHGDVVETGGKGIFQKIMEWHLNLAKKSS
ncbi:hypothetical protein BU26DRAFT_520092 [Trematosphaeria pertusa]|uniref:DUF4336 domain-containing protein n=1 Tax=Trematosphaeria pertusa TaxID=390896 RepID=A0A6A6IDD8_9PLEO|nr:uncharacterized protein BU26DRAFT_520092 [Trematosphaeria pertusa]KAF2248411.1 hypothetical protein BU26DRAFT_520092 [Trematosphaeria pertusa]